MCCRCIMSYTKGLHTSLGTPLLRWVRLGHRIMGRLAELVYATTGNEYYLLEKGMIKL